MTSHGDVPKTSPTEAQQLEARADQYTTNRPNVKWTLPPPSSVWPYVLWAANDEINGVQGWRSERKRRSFQNQKEGKRHERKPKTGPARDLGINRLRDNIFDRLWAAFRLVSGELTYQLNISSKIKKNRTNKTYLYEALQGPGINQFSVFHYRDKYSSVRWGILPQIPHRGINPQAPLKKNYEAYKNFETGPRKP